LGDKKEINSAQQKWEKASAETEKIIDSLGCSIDENIARAIFNKWIKARKVAESIIDKSVSDRSRFLSMEAINGVSATRICQ